MARDGVAIDRRWGHRLVDLERGPLGSMHRGWDPGLERAFTLLRLCPRLVADRVEWQAAEARLSAVERLSVRGVAMVLGAVKPRSVMYAAVDGPSLGELAKVRAAAGRRLSWPELASVVGPLAETVDALPIAHGLIGPGTVRLTPAGPVLTAYGIGYAVPARSLAIAHLGAAESDAAFGPECWAPGYGSGRATDVFALAATVAELWGGPALREALAASPPRDPFLRVLAEGLRPEPALRPRSAVGWFAALRARAPRPDPAPGAPQPSPSATRALHAPGDSALHPR